MTPKRAIRGQINRLQKGIRDYEKKYLFQIGGFTDGPFFILKITYAEETARAHMY